MTLRANELRIGNIVNDPSGFGPMIVEAINPSPGRVYLRSMDGEYLGDFDIAKIEGVPLTEEWLIRFGFEKVVDHDYRINDFRVRFTHFDYPAFNFWTNGECSESIGQDLKTVHHLQNIYFAVTGIELLFC